MAVHLSRKDILRWTDKLLRKIHILGPKKKKKKKLSLEGQYGLQCSYIKQVEQQAQNINQSQASADGVCHCPCMPPHMPETSEACYIMHMLHQKNAFQTCTHFKRFSNLDYLFHPRENTCFFFATWKASHKWLKVPLV